MDQVGIRALKQNASKVVANVVAGATVTITDHGRPVAQLTALPSSGLQRLLAAGRARAARHSFSELPEPLTGPELSPLLQQTREEERY